MTTAEVKAALAKPPRRNKLKECSKCGKMLRNINRHLEMCLGIKGARYRKLMPHLVKRPETKVGVHSALDHHPITQQPTHQPY